MVVSVVVAVNRPLPFAFSDRAPIMIVGLWFGNSTRNSEIKSEQSLRVGHRIYGRRKLTMKQSLRQTGKNEDDVHYIPSDRNRYRATNREHVSGKSTRSFLLVVPLRARLHSPPDLIFFALLLRHFHILSL